MRLANKLFVVAVLIAAVLSISVVGVSCSSAEDSGEETPADTQDGGAGGAMAPGMGLSEDLLVRVAEILGIDQTEVSEAFEQAQSEMADDMPSPEEMSPEGMPEDMQPPEGMSPEDMPEDGQPPEGMPGGGQPGGMTPGMGLSEDLLARVAEILGIDQQELADAVEQAWGEMMEDMPADGSGSSQE